MSQIDLKDADYVIVVKKTGDWTVYDGDGSKEWQETELNKFQGKDRGFANASMRRVFVEYKVNPRLVCFGNYCRYI